jgi:membrane protease YdiL (CAAX protease family)
VRALAVRDRRPATAVRGEPGAATAAAGVAAGVLGAASLALRPVGWGGVLATVAVGLVAVAAAPTQTPDPVRLARAGGGVRSSSPAMVLAVGLLAVAAARMAGAPLPGPASAVGVGASLAAAVAEEALFRGVLQGALQRLQAGQVLAIGLPAALFALVHVPGYGPGSLPVNLAAGLLLGWQRHAVGSWTVPAATHGAANLIRFL